MKPEFDYARRRDDLIDMRRRLMEQRQNVVVDCCPSSHREHDAATKFIEATLEAEDALVAVSGWLDALYQRIQRRESGKKRPVADGTT